MLTTKGHELLILPFHSYQFSPAHLLDPALEIQKIEIISSAFASHFFFDIFFVFLLNSCLTQHLSVCSAQ